MSTTNPLALGWLMMAGLIVAIGAQNALVLRQGLLRRHVAPVVALCTLSDWALTILGVFGLGGLLAASPMALAGLRYAGAAVLLFYAWRAARRVFAAPEGLAASSRAAAGSQTLGQTLAGACAVTWLNPHVYLDTVVLLGAAAAAFNGPGKLAFAAGAGLASMMWFTALGYGAAALAPRLARPAVWRGIDALVALVMLATALQLLFGG